MVVPQGMLSTWITKASCSCWKSLELHDGSGHTSETLLASVATVSQRVCLIVGPMTEAVDLFLVKNQASTEVPAPHGEQLLLLRGTSRPDV